MSSTSSIQWTDATWNPTTGCTRVSPGCDHCYAFQLHDTRHIAWKRGRWDNAPEQYHQPFSHVQLVPERLDDPEHWRKPRRIFVNTMSDLFHPAVPYSYINEVWMRMFNVKRHTYQILTKRPERLQAWTAGKAHAMGWPADEVWPSWTWVGTSIENQAAADDRIPHLLATPATVRFLSCEPLLGPVNLTHWLTFPGDHDRAEWSLEHYGASQPLHWVILGGESGPHARPMDLAWVGTLIEQCLEAGVTVFVKQLGTVWAHQHGAQDRHGGDAAEWPEDLRIREFPTVA